MVNSLILTTFSLNEPLECWFGEMVNECCYKGRGGWSW